MKKRRLLLLGRRTAGRGVGLCLFLIATILSRPVLSTIPSTGLYVGWTGHDNLGDEALYRISVDVLKHVHLALKKDPYAPPFSIVTVHPNNFNQYMCPLHHYNGYDIVIMGGGSILDDSEYHCPLSHKLPTFAFGTGWYGLSPRYYVEHEQMIQDMIKGTTIPFGRAIASIVSAEKIEVLQRMKHVRFGGVRTKWTLDLLKELAFRAPRATRGSERGDSSRVPPSPSPPMTNLRVTGDGGLLGRWWAEQVLDIDERIRCSARLRNAILPRPCRSFLQPGCAVGATDSRDVRSYSNKGESGAHRALFPPVFDRPTIILNFATCKGSEFEFHSCGDHGILADATVRAMRFLVGLGWDIVFFAMDPKDANVVKEMHRRTAESFGSMRQSVKLLDVVPDLPHLLALLESASMTISYRLHGAIFSCAMGTPFVHLAYQYKGIAFPNELSRLLHPQPTPQDAEKKNERTLNYRSEVRSSDFGTLSTHKIVDAAKRGSGLGAKLILKAVDAVSPSRSNTNSSALLRACARAVSHSEGAFFEETFRFLRAASQ